MVSKAIRLERNGRGELSTVPPRKLRAQKTELTSGLVLILLSLMGMLTPWVFNLPEQRVLNDYYGVAVYAAVALGMVISALVYGFTAAFNERWTGK